MEKISLLKLRKRIHLSFLLFFRYSRKRNCLYGTFAVVPDGLRDFVESFGFRYLRFPDGVTLVEFND